MSLAEIVESSGWKNFIAKLYGLGASVVIVGALFKIQHWPLAGLMLTVGLLVEALIFFFSAFEPLHEELDWTLVYPELAGISEDEEESYSHSKGGRGRSGGNGGYGGGAGAVALAKFDEMLENAEKKKIIASTKSPTVSIRPAKGQCCILNKAPTITIAAPSP